MTKQIMVGNVAVGGGAPVSIQSMCNTKTDDVAATVAQIHRLEEAGCEIIRVAIPDQAAAEAVDRIKEQIHIPLVADIHFNYRFALLCAERGIPPWQRDTLPVLRIGERPAAVPGIGVHTDFAPAACGPAAYVRFYQKTEEKHHEE